MIVLIFFTSSLPSGLKKNRRIGGYILKFFGCQSADSVLIFMKNFFNFVVCLLVIMYFGLACKNNPLSKFTNQYNCTIAGEPEPKTSEDYYNRASKHIEIFSGNGAPSLDDCAFAALNEAIRLDPNNVQSLRVRGYGYRQKRQYDLALADFDKAIQIEPNNPDNFFFRGLTCHEKGLLDNAIEDISKAIDLTPKEDSKLQDLYQRRADFYREKGDYENLIKQYTEQIRIKPAWGGNYSQRADAYVKKGDFENAVKDYTEAIRLDSECKWDCEQEYYRRAEAYRKLGKNDLAEADMKKFNELMPEKDGRKTTSEPTKNPNDSNSPKTVSGGVLNGKATNLVQPTYPAAARAVRASGAVNVQVTVDENGNVISATAVSGHALLRPSAVQAAKESKFNPTLLSGQKVRVSGIVVYNF